MKIQTAFEKPTPSLRYLPFWVEDSTTTGAPVAGEQLLWTALLRLVGLEGINSEKLPVYMTLIIFQVCAS